MKAVPATWFDGRSTRSYEVSLSWEGDALLLRSASAHVPERRYAAEGVRLSEPSISAPLAINLPDGSTAWVMAGEGVQALRLATSTAGTAAASGAGRMGSPTGSASWLNASRWIASWPVVVACVFGSVAVLAWFDRQGAAWMAEAAIHVTPLSADRAIGQQVFTSLKEEWLATSRIPQKRQDAVRRRFLDLAQRVHPEYAVELHFHGVKSGRWQRDKPDHKDPRGFNAFALPGGQIVLLDGLAHALSDDELMVVLGHELGHVVHRHGLKAVARSVGLLTVAGAVFGDVSTVLAAGIAGFQGLKHSRAAEREADAFGRHLSAVAGWPAATEQAVWRKLDQLQDTFGGGEVPDWLSTHPNTRERLEAARQAERPPAAKPAAASR